MAASEGPVRLLTRSALAPLSAEAARSSRRRLNLNLHRPDDPVHRLFNAIEPGSYVRPHRHRLPPRTELVVAVSGAPGLLTFDPEGRILAAHVLCPGGDLFAAELGPDTWHSVVALEPETVFLEVKEGPYVKPDGADVAAWAPVEGSPEAAEEEERWRGLFTRPRGLFASI